MSLPLRVQIEIEKERRRRLRAGRTPAKVTEHYGEWLASARSELRKTEDDPADAEAASNVRWDYRHFVHGQAVLDRVTAGELRRVLFQWPIRHGKTQHNTIGYGAYRIERRPATRLLICSYNQVMADKFSRKIRTLTRDRGVALSLERDSAREWETIDGGGVRALGAGTGAASIDADGIIIDDPIGSRGDAESQATRDAVWDWITNDILARCEPHTWVVMQMSRWHKDDPSGRLQDRQAGRWHLVDLPGRAIKYDPSKPLTADNKPDELGRAEGEALWPELRGSDWLDEKRAELNEYGFASLIQGRPRPREGGMFQWDWWQLIPEAPLKGRVVRYWDLAGTDAIGGNDPDWTSGAAASRMPDKRTALLDMARFRCGVFERDAKIEQVAREDKATYGVQRLVWWIETEAGIDGKRRTAVLVRRIQALGITVYTEHPTGDKVFRAEPLASKAQAGNVVLVKGEWNDAFRTEAADFPFGTHDDQIDSAGAADSKLDDDVGGYGSSSHKV